MDYSEPQKYLIQGKKKEILIASIKSLIIFIMAIVSVIFGLAIMNLWQNSSEIVFLFRESIPEVKLGFVGFMIFCGLYFINILVKLIIWKGEQN